MATTPLHARFMALIMTLLLGFLLIRHTHPPLIAQSPLVVNFRPYAMNPVLTAGQPGLWDEAAVAMPSVAHFQSDLLLYFTGSDHAANTLIGLATSADGFTWTKAEENPLLSVSTGNIARFVPVIDITDSGLVVAYFDTHTSPGQATGQNILRATATTPTGPWMVEPDPVLVPGAAGTWDEAGITPGSVLPTGNTWNLYFDGLDAGMTSRIGLATSTDGLEWEKNGGPVLDVGEAGSWDSGGVRSPSVLQTGELWEMFYVGHNGNDIPTGIGYAYSVDGLNWNKYPENPVLQIEGSTITTVTATRQGDMYILYYDEALAGTSYPVQISAATGTVAYSAVSPAGPTVTPPRADDPTRTPAGEVIDRFEDDRGDAQRCDNGAPVTDGEVDLAELTITRTENNALYTSVRLVSPLVNDYSFAVALYLFHGQNLTNAYLWEIHNSQYRIGPMDPQTYQLLQDVPQGIVIDHNQQQGAVSFTLPDNTLPESVDYIAARSFHTPNAETQPQPTHCDVAGPFLLSAALR